MALFGNAKPVELLFNVRISNMTLKASGKISVSMKLHYLGTLLNEGALHQFETFHV